MKYVLPNERLGLLLGERYRLLHVLAEGGTSVVYEAEDERTTARVALKLLKPELAVEEEASRRFAQEAKLSVSFAHPAAVRVFDSGGDEHAQWVVSELVDGPSLADHLRATGPLEADAIVDLLLPLIEAVAAAHFRGAIHRDLKPSNVMLAELSDGRFFPKLVDFGLARLDDGPGSTTRGRLLGTPHYMSPEQAAGTYALTPAVDVWALGVILFECIEGKRPFDGPSSTAVLMQVMRFDAPPLRRLTRDSPLAAVVARALARAPDDRFVDAGAMSRALMRARSPRTLRTRSVFSRSRALWLAAVLGVGGMLGALSTLALATRETSEQSVAARPAKPVPIAVVQNEPRPVAPSLAPQPVEGVGTLASAPPTMSERVYQNQVRRRPPLVTNHAEGTSEMRSLPVTRIW